MKINEYMKKEAGIDWSALGLAGMTGEKLTELAPYLVGVPLLLGSGAGYLASKATSPAAADVDTLQQEALLTKLKAETGLRQRSMLAKKRLQELQDEADKGEHHADRREPRPASASPVNDQRYLLRTGTERQSGSEIRGSETRPDDGGAAAQIRLLKRRLGGDARRCGPHTALRELAAP